MGCPRLPPRRTPAGHVGAPVSVPVPTKYLLSCRFVLIFSKYLDRRKANSQQSQKCTSANQGAGPCAPPTSVTGTPWGPTPRQHPGCRRGGGASGSRRVGRAELNSVFALHQLEQRTPLPGKAQRFRQAGLLMGTPSISRALGPTAGRPDAVWAVEPPEQTVASGMADAVAPVEGCGGQGPGVGEGGTRGSDDRGNVPLETFMSRKPQQPRPLLSWRPTCWETHPRF